jgi:hypothetical protein
MALGYRALTEAAEATFPGSRDLPRVRQTGHWPRYSRAITWIGCLGLKAKAPGLK